MSENSITKKQAKTIIGAVALIVTASFIAGFLIAGQEDTTHFEDVMNREALDTLSHANESFNNEETQTGFDHTKSSTTMLWANLQVTDNQDYEELWGMLTFGCFINEDPEECQDNIETVYSYIDNHLYEQEEEEEDEEEELEPEELNGQA